MFSFYVNVETTAPDGVECSTGSSLATMMQDAREMFARYGTPVFGEIVLEKDNEIVYEDDRTVSERFLLIEKSDMKISINVSKKFEPGMESIEDFLARVAVQLHILGARTIKNPDITPDLAKDLDLLSVEGEY